MNDGENVTSSADIKYYEMSCQPITEAFPV